MHDNFVCPQATFCALFQCAAAAGAAWHRRRFGGAGDEGSALHVDIEDAMPISAQHDTHQAYGSYVTDDRVMNTGGSSSSSSSSSSSALDSQAVGHSMEGVEAPSIAVTTSTRSQQQQQSFAAGFAMEAEEQDAFVQQQLWLEERQVWVIGVQHVFPWRVLAWSADMHWCAAYCFHSRPGVEH